MKGIGDSLPLSIGEALQNEVIYSRLIDLESSLEKAFRTGRTPLILDTSNDDQVCTFYSYQVNAIILETKGMILSRQPLLKCMEAARNCLVNAMKFGKLLVIRLGTSSPDFRGKFNDENLKEVDITLRDSLLSYFPIEVFLSGGLQLHDEFWVRKLFREEDMKPHKNFAICR